MMAIRMAAGALAIASVGAGCGTVANLRQPPPLVTTVPRPAEPPPPQRVYGGVRADWAILREMRWDQEYSFFNVVTLPVTLIDFPLSFVGDTVTLPYTLGHAVYTAIRPAPPPPSADGGSGTK